MLSPRARQAREHGYRLTTRSEHEERKDGRAKVGLYVHFEREHKRRGRLGG